MQRWATWCHAVPLQSAMQVFAHLCTHRGVQQLGRVATQCIRTSQPRFWHTRSSRFSWTSLQETFSCLDFHRLPWWLSHHPQEIFLFLREMRTTRSFTSKHDVQEGLRWHMWYHMTYQVFSVFTSHYALFILLNVATPQYALYEVHYIFR